MRRPSGDHAGEPIRGAAVGQARRLARGDVHQPEVADLVVREPRAVEHVVEAVDEPVVRWRRRAGARLGLAVDAAAAVIVGAGRAVRGGHDDQSGAVRRPFEGVDAARQVGQPARLAAVEGQEEDLVTILAGGLPVLLVRSGLARLFLHEGASVRDEREGPAVGGEPWLAVVPGTERQLARLLAALGGHEPEGVAVAIEARGDGLKRHDRVPAVRGEARFGRDPQAIQVVGAGRARHGDPPESGTREV